jgi:hypothetical protein
MKTFYQMAFMGLGFVLSLQANAGRNNLGNVTCTAQFGEGDGWVVLSIVTDEVCYRCTDPQIVTTATISVPQGPRGAYVRQSYVHKKTVHYRLSSSSFQKRGQPSGNLSGDWNSWFPDEIEVLSGTLEPLYLYFKGESLQLVCK